MNETKHHGHYMLEWLRQQGDRALTIGDLEAEFPLYTRNEIRRALDWARGELAVEGALLTHAIPGNGWTYRITRNAATMWREAAHWWHVERGFRRLAATVTAMAFAHGDDPRAAEMTAAMDQVDAWLARVTELADELAATE
jgi:hypothetical protein